MNTENQEHQFYSVRNDQFIINQSDYECEMYGMGRSMVWTPLKKGRPNLFWRWMQYLILGNRWVKIKKMNKCDGAFTNLKVWWRDKQRGFTDADAESAREKLSVVLWPGGVLTVTVHELKAIIRLKLQ